MQNPKADILTSVNATRKNAIRSLLLISFFLVSCTPSDEFPDLKSSSGDYSISGYADSDGLLVITVKQKNGDDSVEINTRASVYQRFAYGWLDTDSVIMVNSSDIGILAWDITTHYQPTEITGDIQAYAKTLYAEKY
ncbi:hypothetical protein BTA51_16295 [Hahella sp. CCB-MM4]|uniref:hypothetical protein n=1 Tax=Hahella sp. (strain CCB-MM4) TaxID=1926491 RepID=UPI000B9C1A0D|nr:hypothetical protein [Hahella sp. CCB-MM4]OZG72299.1 hypothetical protein BTA51_16295 [Hahella sp. CCB-MM4]